MVCTMDVSLLAPLGCLGLQGWFGLVILQRDSPWGWRLLAGPQVAPAGPVWGGGGTWPRAFAPTPHRQVTVLPLLAGGPQGLPPELPGGRVHGA